MASAGFTATRSLPRSPFRRRQSPKVRNASIGVTYDFKRFVDGESDLQLAALLLDQKVLMAFDLVFSPTNTPSPVRIISITG
jgi:hypothetical protein